jgi:hypothetical protein
MHQQRCKMIFAICSPILPFMFQGVPNPLKTVIRCRGCGENIPAPVEGIPAQPIAATCPLCGQQRRYLPSQVFEGRLSWRLLRSPGTF